MMPPSDVMRTQAGLISLWTTLGSHCTEAAGRQQHTTLCRRHTTSTGHATSTVDGGVNSIPHCVDGTRHRTSLGPNAAADPLGRCWALQQRHRACCTTPVPQGVLHCTRATGRSRRAHARRRKEAPRQRCAKMTPVHVGQRKVERRNRGNARHRMRRMAV